MLQKITPKELKKKLLIKYCFQFFVTPFILGTLLSLIFFIVDLVRLGVNQSYYEFFIESPWWIVGYIGVLFCVFLTNGLSVIPFIKLCFDKIEKVEQAEIKNVHLYPSFEIHGLSKSKAFVFDTFSKKQQKELALFALENRKRKKYRLFLDERWGDIKKLEDIVWRNYPLKITYFKHSKVIVAIEEDTDWCN